MRRSRFIARKEVEIHVRAEPARTHKTTPWYMLARKRIGRVNRASKRRGNLGHRSGTKLYTRRSVVKASYSRNSGTGSWTAHARYLSRENAQVQHARGLGFNSVAEALDIVATVNAWEKSGDGGS